ncbi:MAG: hypothetical protein QOH10_2879 [Actinomycetota bacterium]|nr:hypothetical protein [Actinomycetota bacterium]
MVDSPPSKGRSARDPDSRPAPDSDRDADDREADDAEEREDDRWSREMAALAARTDPVPQEVVDAARRAFTKRGPKPDKP